MKGINRITLLHLLQLALLLRAEESRMVLVGRAAWFVGHCDLLEILLLAKVCEEGWHDGATMCLSCCWAPVLMLVMLIIVMQLLLNSFLWKLAVHGWAWDLLLLVERVHVGLWGGRRLWVENRVTMLVLKYLLLLVLLMLLRLLLYILYTLLTLQVCICPAANCWGWPFLYTIVLQVEGIGVLLRSSCKTPIDVNMVWVVM